MLIFNTCVCRILEHADSSEGFGVSSRQYKLAEGRMDIETSLLNATAVTPCPHTRPNYFACGEGVETTPLAMEDILRHWNNNVCLLGGE